MTPIRLMVEELTSLGIDIPNDVLDRALVAEKAAIKQAVAFGGVESKVWNDIAEQYYNEEYGELWK